MRKMTMMIAAASFMGMYYWFHGYEAAGIVLAALGAVVGLKVSNDRELSVLAGMIIYTGFMLMSSFLYPELLRSSFLVLGLLMNLAASGLLVSWLAYDVCKIDKIWGKFENVFQLICGLIFLALITLPEILISFSHNPVLLNARLPQLFVLYCESLMPFLVIPLALRTIKKFSSIQLRKNRSFLFKI